MSKKNQNSSSNNSNSMLEDARVLDALRVLLSMSSQDVLNKVEDMSDEIKDSLKQIDESLSQKEKILSGLEAKVDLALKDLSGVSNKVDGLIKDNAYANQQIENTINDFKNTIHGTLKSTIQSISKENSVFDDVTTKISNLEKEFKELKKQSTEKGVSITNEKTTKEKSTSVGATKVKAGKVRVSSTTASTELDDLVGMFSSENK